MKDQDLQGDSVLEFMSTEKQLAVIFTKPLCEDQFKRIRHELGMMKTCEDQFTLSVCKNFGPFVSQFVYMRCLDIILLRKKNLRDQISLGLFVILISLYKLILSCHFKI